LEHLRDVSPEKVGPCAYYALATAMPVSLAREVRESTPNRGDARSSWLPRYLDAVQGLGMNLEDGDGVTSYLKERLAGQVARRATSTIVNRDAKKRVGRSMSGPTVEVTISGCEKSGKTAFLRALYTALSEGPAESFARVDGIGRTEWIEKPKDERRRGGLERFRAELTIGGRSLQLCGTEIGEDLGGELESASLVCFLVDPETLLSSK